MPRKRKNLKYKKERAILSDVLPYETPVTFTNRHFYEFVLNNHIEFKNGCLFWKKEGKLLDNLIHLMFSLPENTNRIKVVSRNLGEDIVDFNCYNFCHKGGKPKPSIALVPFEYKISHKRNEFRGLSIPHPRNQMEVVEFYDSCKEMIMYYCSISPFCIRKPAKLAKYKFHKDRTHYEKLAEDSPLIEEKNREYESLRSFFVYEKYSNIYKFYESYQHHRCEKKYNKLLKLDISKCFDSIYTHSLSWALLGKDSVKENISGSNKTFAGRFDDLMQRMNHKETNGIIIGPEFSRIFAELILQSIDTSVEEKLELSSPSIKHKIDYEMFRYVDDYFIFYNEDDHREVIVDQLQHALKDFKLHLNSAKALHYEKPIITEISMAKQQIAVLIEESLKYNLEKVEDENGDIVTKGSIYINTNRLITQFKTIIKECDVEYKDMLNYALATTENKCDKILKNYNKTTTSLRSHQKLINAILSILEFVFFIYAVSPRVNTTIRLCRILRIFCKFMSSSTVDYESKHLVYKFIYDNVCFIIKKNKSDEYTQVETLYLLVALSELGKDYWLEQDLLASYFNFYKNTDTNEFESSHGLNYFSYTVLLFYMAEKVRYKELREFVIKQIEEEFNSKKVTKYKDAELTMLLFDMTSCPYVPKDSKRKLLALYGIDTKVDQDAIIDYRNKHGGRQLWFTTWHDFDFGLELDTKQSQEVY